jgi:hypothetical protein
VLPHLEIHIVEDKAGVRVSPPEAGTYTDCVEVALLRVLQLVCRSDSPAASGTEGLEKGQAPPSETGTVTSSGSAGAGAGAGEAVAALPTAASPEPPHAAGQEGAGSGSSTGGDTDRAAAAATAAAVVLLPAALRTSPQDSDARPLWLPYTFDLHRLAALGPNPEVLQFFKDVVEREPRIGNKRWFSSPDGMALRTHWGAFLNERPDVFQYAGGVRVCVCCFMLTLGVAADVARAAPTSHVLKRCCWGERGKGERDRVAGGGGGRAAHFVCRLPAREGVRVLVGFLLQAKIPLIHE